jgi:hypothetical protein
VDVVELVGEEPGVFDVVDFEVAVRGDAEWLSALVTRMEGLAIWLQHNLTILVGLDLSPCQSRLRMEIGGLRII